MCVCVCLFCVWWGPKRALRRLNVGEFSEYVFVLAMEYRNRWFGTKYCVLCGRGRNDRFRYSIARTKTYSENSPTFNRRSARFGPHHTQNRHTHTHTKRHQDQRDVLGVSQDTNLKLDTPKPANINVTCSTLIKNERKTKPPSATKINAKCPASE